MGELVLWVVLFHVTHLVRESGCAVLFLQLVSMIRMALSVFGPKQGTIEQLLEADTRK